MHQFSDKIDSFDFLAQIRRKLDFGVEISNGRL